MKYLKKTDNIGRSTEDTGCYQYFYVDASSSMAY